MNGFDSENLVDLVNCVDPVIFCVKIMDLILKIFVFENILVSFICSDLEDLKDSDTAYSRLRNNKFMNSNHQQLAENKKSDPLVSINMSHMGITRIAGERESKIVIEEKEIRCSKSQSRSCRQR